MYPTVSISHQQCSFNTHIPHSVNWIWFLLESLLDFRLLLSCNKWLMVPTVFTIRVIDGCVTLILNSKHSKYCICHIFHFHSFLNFQNVFSINEKLNFFLRILKLFQSNCPNLASRNSLKIKIDFFCLERFDSRFKINIFEWDSLVTGTGYH